MWASLCDAYGFHAVCTLYALYSILSISLCCSLSLSSLHAPQLHNSIFKLYYIIKNACCAHPNTQIYIGVLWQNLPNVSANVSAHISVKVSEVEDLMRKKDKFPNHIHRSSYACVIQHFSNDDPVQHECAPKSSVGVFMRHDTPILAIHDTRYAIRSRARSGTSSCCMYWLSLI